MNHTRVGGAESTATAFAAGTSDDALRHLLLSAALSMSLHPQDHGWRQIYSHIAQALSDDAEPLMTLVNNIPGVSNLAPAYVIGLMAISLQQLWHEQRHGAEHRPRRLPGGEIVGLARDHQLTLRSILANHRNSFTGVRRFLVPQVLLARHFAGAERGAVTFLDIGTGIGVLPRQLDSHTCFDRFEADLAWPRDQPTFAKIGLGTRFGMELSPAPDLDWVHNCYGPSDYYDQLFAEMQESLAMAEVRATELSIIDQDACELPALGQFIADHSVLAVTAVYSLYQYAAPMRRAIAETIHRSLPPGGIFLDIEPNPSLDQPGCLVEAWIGGVPDKLTVCRVSDGHFQGFVMAAKDYDRFVRCWRW